MAQYLQPCSRNSSYTLELNVSESSYSIPENNSSVSWSLYLVSTGYNFSLIGMTAVANINGQEVLNSYAQRTIAKNSRLLLGSGTITVPHNSDGTKTIAVSASLTMNSTASYTPGNTTVSGSLTLTTIPRTSGVSCNSFNIGDSTTITISRASSSFTHTLVWSFGNDSGTIVTKTGETTIGTTIPANRLYAQIPSATYGTGTITCYTYSGNTLIGTSSCPFTAYAKPEECTPTVSDSSNNVIDTNSTTIALTGSNLKLIKGFSTAQVTVSATARNYASITGAYIATSDNRTAYTSVYSFPYINGNSFYVQATDSRGYTTGKTITKTGSNWIDYVKLALTTAKVERPESTVDRATITLAGNYFNGNFGVQNNSLTLQYRYKETGGTYSDWEIVYPTITGNTFSYSETLENLNHEKEYIFQFYAVDKLQNIVQDVTLTKGIPIIRVGKNYVRINGISVLPKIQNLATYNGGNIDPNTTLEPLILSRHANCPENTAQFYFIHTYFYASVGVNSNRSQIAFGYQTNKMHQRFYHDGSWSVWQRVGDNSTIMVYAANQLYIDFPTAWTSKKVPVDYPLTYGDALSFDSTNKRIVVNKSGYVNITGQLDVYANGYPGGDYSLSLWKNGSLYSEFAYEYLNGNAKSYEKLQGKISAIPVQAGEYLEMNLTIGGSGTVRIFAGGMSSLTVEYLGV